ncbi:MAG: response regulator [Gammaproteobacteria bacterium]|nr:response regulator [Gammaproteobacteria bacterium]
MGQRMREFDWSGSPLGPPGLWPQSLKTIVRVMLDSRYAMWMLWGPELTFFCNDAYLPTVGIKRDWVLGARSDKVWEEIWPDIGPRIRQVLERGHSTWDEGLRLYLERHGFSEETYHTFSYSPVYDDAGRISGMLCVVTEVTERVLAERRLQTLRELGARASFVERAPNASEACRVAVESLAGNRSDLPFAAVLLVDRPQRSAETVATTGTDAATLGLEGRLTLERPAGAWPLDELARTRRPALVESITVPTGEAARSVTRAWVAPITAPGHEGIAAILVLGLSPHLQFDDAYQSFLEQLGVYIGQAITNARAYEEERLRAEALAEIDRAKTTFFSNVSHEFRTPLTLLLGPLEEMLEAADLSERARERVGLAHRNSLRLLRLVNALLDFSRIEAGRANALFTPVDLAALTADFASTFRSALERAGLEFRVECVPLDEPVWVDPEMWEKVVLNLLSNAFKFTLQGHVALRLWREGAEAVLEVEDSGVGVPAHEMPRLFERFHRVEGAQGRTFEGSGIGLALVQELVRLHRGQISARSALGLGTTFQVRVPFGTAGLPPERMRAAPRAPSGAARTFVEEALRWLPESVQGGVPLEATAAEAASHRARFAATLGARIVLADDNRDMRQYLRTLLDPYYAIEAVGDGAAALAAIRRERPALIISDVMMPRLDGFGLLRQLRADQELAALPVMLLSARAGESARVEGLDAGADDYLIKPFAARELLARVGALLERTRVQAQVAERNAQFVTLVTSAPVGIFLLDADLKVREVNPTARAVFSSLPELVGEDFESLVRRLRPPKAAEEILRLFRNTLQTGTPHFATDRVADRLDRAATEYYEWQINRIPLPDGRFGVVCYFRDISTHVAARKALLEQQRELESADQQKNEFLAMLAHELRNPLAPIRNLSEVLGRTLADNPEGRAAVASIDRQVTHLARLVDDLLDVSRITRGQIELRKQIVPVQAVLTRALETVDPALRHKRHRLSVAESEPGLTVHGDPERLVQCLANVLNNAAKYTDPGGDIRLETVVENTDVVLRVTDSGAGIAPELLPRVFDLFVQGERTLDRAHGGLGIGLSIVRQVIELHGGAVRASSPGVGGGSTFELRLPLSQEPAAPRAERTVGRATAEQVLIVDDNEDAAESLAMVLRLDGHTVQTAYNGEQALARAQQLRPRVVLLDIGLPGLDGYEVARRLKARQPAGEELCLIAITGYGQDADRERATAAGFAHHLVKPIDFSSLQEILLSIPPPRLADPQGASA